MKQIVLCFCFVFTGCVSTPGRTWTLWNPTTWGAASEARQAERLTAKDAEVQDRLIKEAQKTAHETSIALTEIPASNAKETAADSNRQTVSLLDQAAGPLTAKELTAIREQVSNLLSSNEDLRRKGEVQRQENRKAVEELSQEKAELQSKLASVNIDLQAAAKREAIVANKWRNAVFGLWALGLASVVSCGAALYLKVVYGGVFQAGGKFLSTVYAKNPEQGQNIEDLLGKYLSPAALKKILSNSA